MTRYLELCNNIYAVVHNFTVENNAERVSGFITDKVPFLPLDSIKVQIKKGEVRINGQRIFSDVGVARGDNVRIFLPERLESSGIMLNKVYQDKHVLVVNKPVLCEVETHLTDILAREYPWIAPVHRLDRNTTGLVVFAKSETIMNELFRLIKARKIDKFYKAEVFGRLKKPKSMVTVYLCKDEMKGKVSVSDVLKTGYKEAVLEYEVIKQLQDSSVVDIKLITGRTHQIRATFAHLGNPIIGDGKYGIEKINRMYKARYQRLHAYKIVFNWGNGESELLSYLSSITIEL